MAALSTHRVQVRLGPVVRRVRVPAIPRVAIGQLAAAALSLSLSAGALSVVSQIAGAGAAYSQGSGALSIGRPLSSAGNASASSSGDLFVVRGLSAFTTAPVQTVATLQVAGGLSGASAATSQASGALTIQRNFIATENATSASAGAISVTASITASSAAQSLSAGLLTVQKQVAASTSAPSEAGATLTVSKGFDAAGVSASATTGALSVGNALSATTLALSVPAGALNVVRGLAAASSAPSTATAVLSAGGGEDADAAAYLNAQTTPPSSTERSLVNTLVKGLKTDGIWIKLDRLSLLAAETAQAARLCLRNPTKSVVATNLPAFTANRGYMGDATSAFLDLGEPFAFAGANFVLDSASIFYVCNLGSATVGLQGHIGSTGALRAGISARNNAGNNTFAIGDSTASAYAGTGARTGFRCASRVESTTKRIYNADGLVTSLAVTSTSVSATNGCALRSTASYSDDRLAVLGSGGGLTAAEIANLNTRLNTYLTAKGAA